MIKGNNRLKSEELPTNHAMIERRRVESACARVSFEIPAIPLPVKSLQNSFWCYTATAYRRCLITLTHSFTLSLFLSFILSLQAASERQTEQLERSTARLAATALLRTITTTQARVEPSVISHPLPIKY